MNDIVEFLRARYTEEKAMAEASAAEHGADWWDGQGAVMARSGVVALGCQGDLDPADSRYIVSRSPRWSVNDIDAKLRIIAAHDQVHECISHTGSSEPSTVDGRPWELWELEHTDDSGPCFVVRCLVLPYSDHPDYRQEWTP